MNHRRHMNKNTRKMERINKRLNKNEKAYKKLIREKQFLLSQMEICSVILTLSRNL